MSKMKWLNGSLTLLLAGVITSGVFFAVQASEHHQELTSQKASLSSSSETNQAETTSMETQLKTVETAVALKTSLVDKRPAYVEALKLFSAEYATAEGKIDASGERQIILDSQTKVLSTEKPEDIDTEINVVNQQKQSLTDKVAVYNAEQEANAARKAAEEKAAAERVEADKEQKQSIPGTQKPDQSQPSPQPKPQPQPQKPQQNWFDQMRQILNDVGGSDVTLETFDGKCGDVTAEACTRYNGVIQVSESISGWSYSWKVWAMRHELAHVYQLKVWDQIMNSPTYKSMFGSYIELLANCMAAGRGSPLTGNMACTTEQVRWADNIWYGRVPN